MRNFDVTKPPLVVWHVAGMGHWKEVVPEQIALLQESGITEGIRITYLGDDEGYLTRHLDEAKFSYEIVASDRNLHHCETLAIAEVERLAKKENVNHPILYFHTKGVSNPGHWQKQQWRRLMQEHVIRQWRVNMPYLLDHDAVGVNWIEGGTQHFSGTFWIAHPEWLRRLPPFTQYHAARGMDRYSCEMWIGACEWCKAKSLACKNEPFWENGYDFGRWMPNPVIGSFDYRGTGMDQPPAVLGVIPKFLKEVRPERVLEIGTGKGGFARLVRHALNSLEWRHVPVTTVDVVHRDSTNLAAREGVDVRVQQVFDADYKTLDAEFVRFITQPGRTVVFCDGAAKDKEFALFARLAKVGDVICAHDYAPNRRVFTTKYEGRTWNWLEATDEMLAPAIAMYGMKQLDAVNMQEAMWGAWEKTANGTAYDGFLPPIAGRIGVGIVTYNRPDYFRQSVGSLVNVLDRVDAAFVYNDGSPDPKAYYPLYADLPAKVRVCHNDENRGVAYAKNQLLRRMLDDRCEFIFLMEDDNVIKDGGVFKAYIDAHIPRAVEHMNFAHHGPANAAGPVANLTKSIDLFPNVVGSFSFYTSNCLRLVGLMHEGFKNCWEHVEHTARIAQHGLTTDFWRFADLANSADYIAEIPGSIERSSIRTEDGWDQRVRDGLAYWKANLTTPCPIDL